MTALTIDLDDRLIDALRETAARRRTTVDAIVGEIVAPLAGFGGTLDEVELAEVRRTFSELAARAPLSFEPDRKWDREETHVRPVLR